MIRLKDRSPPKKSSAKKLTARIRKTMPIGQLIKIIHPQFLKTEIMKTLDLKRKADNNGSNGTATAVQTAQAKNGAMPNSTTFGYKKEDAKKVETAQAVQVPQTPKPQTEEPKAEEKKEEAKPIIAEKPALNLEGTLKLVEELHRRKIHRDNLLSTINTLDGFKVLVQDENEDIDSAQFQGCKLTIEDDDRNSFITKNPAIIKAVADYVNKLCVDKLAEIEANIVIPA
ncbi:hypothetical protein [Pedobacter frigoris]|uniref:Uncharacterized protein n=1 Tax=Pedobacter frigoris TaxID=2571272 RepID=A0A4U1CDJ1_9SPHI|nr:hypothetical protein [Pedobacter frigoris]TKC04351.1 hypothetical protein FA047_17355 [Pedobacter frigoris]